MELVNIKNNQAVTSSITVAATFQKQHKDVLRAIDELLGVAQNCADLFHETTYEHHQNRQQYRKVLMNKRGFMLLAMGFTGTKALEFKMAFLDEFDRLEKALENRTPQISQSEITLRLAQQQFDQEKRIEMIETKLDKQMTIDFAKQQALLNTKNIRVERLWSSQNWDGTLFDTKKKLHSRAWRDLKNAFGASSYKDIRMKDFEEAMNYMKAWRPSLF